MDQYAILYEDEDILIANKLATVPVQPEKSGDRSLQDLLKDELSARSRDARATGGRASPTTFLEAAHRIDRRASGAVLFAKTTKALSTLEAGFRGRRIEKEYIACVEREPLPAEGSLEHRLVWDKRRNVVRALSLGSNPPVKSESARLEYRLVGRSERYFFVEVRLITGRHHQIRAQFSAAGFPIRGDLKYGARRSCLSGLIMLHARHLSLSQPRTGGRVEVLAPFPSAEPLWAAFTMEGDKEAAAGGAQIVRPGTLQNTGVTEGNEKVG